MQDSIIIRLRYFLFKYKTAAILLATVFISLLAGAVFTKMVSSNPRWSVYLFVGPLVLFSIYKTKNSVFKIAAVIAIIIFIDDTFINRFPFTNYFKVTITLFFGLTAFVSYLLNDDKIKFPKFFPALWIFFFISVIASVIIGSSKGENFLYSNTQNFVPYFLEFFLFFYLGYLAFNSPEKLKNFFFVLFIFGIIVALGHIYALSTGKQFGLVAELNQQEVTKYDWRYGGFFGNVNTQSAFYVMLIPAALLYLLSEKNILRKVIVLVSISIMTLSLLFGGSRGGVLFLAINIVIAFFFLRVDLKTKISGIITIVIISAIVGFFLQEYFFEFFERTFERFSEKGLEDTTRAKNFQASFQIMLDNPFGIGVSQMNFIPLLMEYANIYFASPHNVYLEMGLQVGINGLIAFLALVGLTLFYNIKTFRNTDNSALKLALALSFLMLSGFLLMGLTEPIFRNYFKLNHIFGLMLGISLSMYYRYQNGLYQQTETQSEIIYR